MANKRETKRERFVRVAEVRTQKVLDDLHSLGKCAAPAIYEYNEEDLAKIFSAIEAELQWVRDSFAGNHRFKLSVKEGEGNLASAEESN